MELPEDLVERIAETCVRAGGLKEWCRSWRGTCRRFSSLRWFAEVARGGVPLTAQAIREMSGRAQLEVRPRAPQSSG